MALPVHLQRCWSNYGYRCRVWRHMLFEPRCWLIVCLTHTTCVMFLKSWIEIFSHVLWAHCSHTLHGIPVTSILQRGQTVGGLHYSCTNMATAPKLHGGTGQLGASVMAGFILASLLGLCSFFADDERAFSCETLVDWFSIEREMP